MVSDQADAFQAKQGRSSKSRKDVWKSLLEICEEPAEEFGKRYNYWSALEHSPQDIQSRNEHSQDTVSRLLGIQEQNCPYGKKSAREQARGVISDCAKTCLTYFSQTSPIQLNEENLENVSWKPSRRLLDSIDGSGTSGAQYALYFLVGTLILIIGLCCQYCLQHGCQPMEYDYGNPVTPRRRRQNRLNSRRSQNPSNISRSSRNLSFETGSQSRVSGGIENPNYNPSIQIPTSCYQPSAPQFSWSEPRIADPTPILDMPPSYETAVNVEQFPSLTGIGFAKAEEKQPLK
ncbi:unnamed protein product [Larinioides sclopetarius]|uniref:Uncharacterized protein n=1 Tax=Larinioides sclopetarius TaxID=280406 RepID=A0AAV1ZWZ9_9ARAC